MTIQHDMRESNIGAEHSSSSVFIQINDRLRATHLSPEHTIFKVHNMLRKENEAAYEPNIVAIGPYHRGKDRLQVMEDWKLRLFKSNLEERGESDATEYVEAMKRVVPEARQWYSESTQNIKEEEFAEMLLLDACFIIQIMRIKGSKTYPFFQACIRFSLILDMLLFENQIPLFVLQEIFSMIKLPQEPANFHQLALKFLNRWLGERFCIPGGTLEKQLNSLTEMLRIDNIKKKEIESNANMLRILETFPRSQSSSSHGKDIHHILGLSHYILRSSAVNDDHSAHHLRTKAKWTKLQICVTAGFKFINKQLRRCKWFDQQCRNVDDSLNSELIPCAVKLHAAGIKFKSKEDEDSPFHISFENGVMVIPKINVEDGTERLFRNLMAYEQYNLDGNNRCVGVYANLMDCLIDSADDVALLRSFGIVISCLGEDEGISIIFNKLCNEVIIARNFEREAKIFQEVNAYCEKRRHKWMAKLKMDYFNSPWALISFFAAVFLLLLTITQTVFSILGGV